VKEREKKKDGFEFPISPDDEDGFLQTRTLASSDQNLGFLGPEP
jgi:hypothetical protein